MTSYFRIKDDVINSLKISQDFCPFYIPTKSQHDPDLNQEKKSKFSSLIMFLAKHSPIIILVTTMATTNDLSSNF